MKRRSLKKNGVVQANNVIALAGKVDLPVGTPVQVEITVVRAKSKVDRSVFGMWKNRKDMKDSRQWVREMREE